MGYMLQLCKGHLLYGMQTMEKSSKHNLRASNHSRSTYTPGRLSFNAMI